MSRRLKWKRRAMFAAPVGLIGLFACFNAPVETPNPKVVQETDVRVEQNVKNQVDLLFVIDDSPSMQPKQNELKARFPQLIKILDDFGKTSPAWYHIGVITSDLGAAQYNLSGQCVPGGKGGKLQSIGAAAATGCVGPSGSNFIDYNQINKDTNGVPQSNLPAGQDLATTFTCMASVGDKGCGFEQDLEAAYKALHDQPADNAGFLRENALLVVVFVTDEDDCSVDPTSDLFDPNKTAAPPAGYGALASFRCTEFGIWCDDGTGNYQQLPYGDSGGAHTGCVSLPPSNGGMLTDVNKYINFFSQSKANGGVKVSPSDVILVGITAPSTSGASSILATLPAPAGPYQQCPGPVSSTCGVELDHSCIASTDNNFFGDPAVRINQVIGAVKNQQLTSICDTSYQAALEGLGELIISNIGAGCIDSPLTDPADPDCIVEDVTDTATGTTVANIPSCAKNGQKAPCWKLDSKPVCDPDPANKVAGCCPAICAAAGEGAQHYGMTICRNDACNGGDPPANTTARVACSTVAVPKDPQTGELPVCGAPL